MLVAEVGSDAQLPRLLDPRPAAGGYPEREIARGIVAIRIDPYEALAEYLGLQTRHAPGLVEPGACATGLPPAAATPRPAGAS